MTSVPSTEITRLREKASTDRAALDKLLDDVHVGHFGIVTEAGHPVVFPTAIARDGDRVLVHGSTGSPWMRALAAGAPTCLTVTAEDGLVVARSAFESSIHYRSAVIFGTCTALADDEREAALDLITEHLLPGRTSEIRRPTSKEVNATQVLAMQIETWSLKVSAGWPDDPDSDVDGPAWAGVVPRVISYGSPLAAPDLRDGIELPPSVQSLV